MNVSLYQATAALNADTPWQDVIAENLADSSIPGARKQEISFSAIPGVKAPRIASLNGGNCVMPSASLFRRALPTLQFVQMAS